MLLRQVLQPVNLLKIILRVFYDLDVTYSVVPPNLLRMMQDHDACLLIGDDAIVAFWNYAKQFYCYDIGKLWYQHTKYPMTYALFAVRNELLTNRTVIQALFEQFQMSKKKSIETGFKELIKPIRSIIGGKTRYWLNYFQGLNYDFSDEHQEGLSNYFDLAKQLGLLRKVDKMIIWDYKHYHSLK